MSRPKIHIKDIEFSRNTQSVAINRKVLRIESSGIRKIFWTAGGILLGIHLLGVAIIDLAGYENSWLFRFFHMFHLDREQNFAAAFSTFLLFFAAGLLALITYSKWTTHAASFRHLWALLSGGFLFMAIDEAWSFHEQLVQPIRQMTNHELPSIFHFAWVLPAILLIGVLGLVFLKFLLKLPPATRASFLLAAFLFLGGAVGMEMLGGYYAAANGQDTLGYVLLTTVEESLEISGVLVFIGGLFRYIRKNFKYLKLDFNPEEA